MFFFDAAMSRRTSRGFSRTILATLEDRCDSSLHMCRSNERTIETTCTRKTDPRFIHIFVGKRLRSRVAAAVLLERCGFHALRLSRQIHRTRICELNSTTSRAQILACPNQLNGCFRRAPESFPEKIGKSARRVLSLDLDVTERCSRAFSSEVVAGSREENASKQNHRAPFRFNRNG